ncbi:MAG: hypothetical protein MUD01_24750 [Chloroflexaceae bacterium]|nr:hypothetical protein [Chloroflexaceae bacterium]
MKVLRDGIIWLGTRMHPLLIVGLIVVLNIYWGVTLAMFGAEFQRVAGSQPIDLQNVSGIISAQQALAQIATYTSETRALYWLFFVLDTLFPPLVFTSFALLWAYILNRQPGRLFERLLHSPLLLIPFGVGFFDWFENLAFIVAITSYPAASTETALQVGLFFVYLKAACLYATFLVTPLLLLYHGFTLLRQHSGGGGRQPLQQR